MAEGGDEGVESDGVAGGGAHELAHGEEEGEADDEGPGEEAEEGLQVEVAVEPAREGGHGELVAGAGAGQVQADDDERREAARQDGGRAAQRDLKYSESSIEVKAS